ncbi:MAG: flavin reductase family protein [Ruminococcus sp.]|nr:flavin reductase family protein [Ruminococcus sp.]
MTERMNELGFKEVNVRNLELNPFKAIEEHWMLVTAGNEKESNTMTASWGGMGVIWNKNVAVTVIRPQRYTKKFVDAGELFTLSFYPDEMKKVLQYCGTVSGAGLGKNEKAKNAGLTELYLDSTVAYEQAELILVCKKLYEAQIKPEAFLDKSLIDSCYPQSDFHQAYVGEIIAGYRK